MPALPSKISFFFDNTSVTLKNRTGLKSFIEGVFKREKKQLVSLNYIFCTDKRLLEINMQCLNHDYYTDIITFDLSESKAIEGEVYISVDRVRDNAKGLSVSLQEELARVMIHGALHLCGYRDKTNAEKATMRTKENYYLLKKPWFHGTLFRAETVSRGTLNFGYGQKKKDLD